MSRSSIGGTPSVIHLLAGGRGPRAQGDALLRQVLAGSGLAHPSIAYVGAANHDDPGFLAMMTESLRRCGAGAVNLVPLAGKRSRPDAACEIMESVDMVFISGGDVEAGMQVLHARGMAPLLRGLYERGKPFFGLSAGSIMLGRHWIRWPDPDDDRTAEVFDCLGLAPVICDTHGEADGWEELQTLIRLSPDYTVGHGIPSGAALAAHHDGVLEALGDPVHRYANRSGRVARIEDLNGRSR